MFRPSTSFDDSTEYTQIIRICFDQSHTIASVDSDKIGEPTKLFDIEEVDVHLKLNDPNGKPEL